MTRHLREFTPGERNAYVVFNQRLADRTLPASEHDTARAELDKLFRRGPYAELHVLKDELQTMKDRLAVLEGFVFSADSPDAARENLERFNTAMGAAPPSGVNSDRVIRADVCQTLEPKQEATAEHDPDYCGPRASDKPIPAPSVDETSAETRGRKALDYHPEKMANKQWQILHRPTGQHTVHGPYKTRREAKEMADTLNKMPRVAESALAGPSAPAKSGPQGGGGAVDTPTRRAAVDAAVGPDSTPATEAEAPSPDASNEEPSLFPEMGF